jgi:hypothetical protein
VPRRSFIVLLKKRNAIVNQVMNVVPPFSILGKFKMLLICTEELGSMQEPRALRSSKERHNVGHGFKTFMVNSITLNTSSIT